MSYTSAACSPFLLGKETGFALAKGATERCDRARQPFEHLSDTPCWFAGFVSFVLKLKKRHYLYQFGQYAWTHMILLFVFVPSSFFVSNIFDGIIWFLLPCSLVIINDISAYLAGEISVNCLAFRAYLQVGYRFFDVLWPNAARSDLMLCSWPGCR